MAPSARKQAMVVAKLVIPRIPRMIKTTARHALSISDTAPFLDLTTAVKVDFLRSFIDVDDPRTLTEGQRFSLIDRGAFGAMWAVDVVAPCPEENLVQLIVTGFETLKTGEETFDMPSMIPVEGVWVGYRGGVKSNALPPVGMTETEKYNAMMKEVKTDLVLFYLHGGAFVYMDPSTHRLPTAYMSKLSGGRAYLVRYRLAPKYPFPAALLDCLISYLTLLYPPPGSLHSATPASKICFGGDSAGGNLCLSLTQLILTLQRLSSDNIARCRFHGTEVEIPLPAGLALYSPFTDQTRCLPSEEKNAKWDYLPPPSRSAIQRPPCPLWPADPPRYNVYCNDDAMLHPLLSPVSASNWINCPPVYCVFGEECLTDGGRFLMQDLYQQHVSVVFEQYQAMPHVFTMLLATNASSKRSYKSQQAFFQQLLADPSGVQSRGTEFDALTLKETPLDLNAISPYSHEVLLGMMDQSVRHQLANGIVVTEMRSKL